MSFDAGGRGDCAYCAVARALADKRCETTPGAKVASAAELAPRGRLQAQLRLLAARELQEHPEQYFLTDAAAKDACVMRTKTAGQHAESRSLHALAEATNCEFRIWAFDDKLHPWQLYVITPRRARAGRQVVWLQLRSRHYTLLRPRPEAGAVPASAPCSGRVWCPPRSRCC